MKNLLPALLSALVLAQPLAASARPRPNAAQDAAAQSALSNRDVLDMHRAGLAPEIVAAKIRNSRTSFDTSPAALQELRAAGVPESVLSAMTRPAPEAVPAGEGDEVKIPEGTLVEVEVASDVSGQDVDVGDIVDLRVVHPLILGGRLVVEQGAHARARVTAVRRARRWGRPGQLEWKMDNVRAVDGQRVPAQFSQRVVGESRTGTVAAAAAASGLLLGPAALAWGLKKGKPAVVPAGKRFSVSLHAEKSVRSRPAPAAKSAP